MRCGILKAYKKALEIDKFERSWGVRQVSFVRQNLVIEWKVEATP